MNERKEKILDIIIKEHIQTGHPVSSSSLVEKYALDCSSATVRNEMADLEEMGLIVQPHTSAGRVPTEEAYRWFVSNLDALELSNELLTCFDALESLDETEFKHAAKAIAATSNAAVFWAFHKHSLYYTGISNLLSQPEFVSQGLVYDISAIIDRLDEIIAESFDNLPEGPEVLLGEECLFGSFLGCVLTKYKLRGQRGVVGIIGPLRQDYAKNLSLISHLKKIINQ